jgi:integrase
VPRSIEAQRGIPAQLVQLEGAWYVRIQLPRSDGELLKPDRQPLSQPPVADRPFGSARALIVAQVEHHPNAGRSLLVPLAAQTISFADGDAGRLTVMGSTKSLETRGMDLVNVPRALIRDLAPLWVESTTNPSTREYRAGVIRIVLRLVGWDAVLSEIDREAAIRLVTELESRKLSITTVRSYTRQCSVFWGFLGKRFQFGFNPFRGLSGAVTGEPQRHRRPYRNDEILLMLTRHSGRPIESSLRLSFAVALVTGARRSEVFAMRQEHLEETPGATWWSIEASKTPAGVRTIPVVHPTARALLRLWVERPRPRPRSASSEHRHFRLRSGLSNEIDYHSARRTLASRLEQAGASPLGIVRYVGHKAEGITFRRYSTAASDRVLLDTAKRLRFAPAVEAALTGFCAEIRADIRRWHFPVRADAGRRKAPRFADEG